MGIIGKSNRARTSQASPPGPKGYLFPSVVRQLLDRKTELQYVTELVRRHGDFVKLPFPGIRVYLLNHPDYVQHVLQENHLNYVRDPGFERLKVVLGENLLTSDGEFWRRQRRIAQPAFHRRNIESFAQIFTTCTEAMLDCWEKIYEREEAIEVHSEMMHLTMDIVTKALFGTSIGANWETAVRAFTLTQEWGYRHRWFPIPLGVPTPWNLRFKQACQTLDRIVYDLIAERRRSNGDQKDLLAMLMNACDEETGRGMSDQQLRNEVLTLFSAGHETTANNLAWTCYLLSRFPSVLLKLEEEVDQVLRGRVPTADDSGRLPYTKMVIQESLRLYPPSRVITRAAIKDDKIGEYLIPAGSIVIFFQWTVHRHPDFWENPEGFGPERFLPERCGSRHPYAYFPFGGGPRKCIGYEFALLETQLVLAMLVQKFRLTLVPGHPVIPDPVITLKPRYGILMNLHKRTSVS